MVVVPGESVDQVGVGASVSGSAYRIRVMQIDGRVLVWKEERRQD